MKINNLVTIDESFAITLTFPTKKEVYSILNLNSLALSSARTLGILGSS